jgi:hypothetical protein
MNLKRNVPPGDSPQRHVIAEYRHRAQAVTCECGWQGSTEVRMGGRSPWQEHVAAHRTDRS